MGVFKVLVIILTVITVYQLYCMYTKVPMPSLDPNPWWAAGPQVEEDISIRDFKINIPKEDVQDLDIRLTLPSRLVHPLEGVNFTYGFTSNTLEKIVDHWRFKYNWRKREAELNKLNHYKTKIEGLDIHFVRAKPNVTRGVAVRPLMLLHGWGSCFVDFIDVMPFLTAPKEGELAFELIIPAIPGFAFSDASAKPGLGVPQTAQIYLKLMKRLGFNKFYVHGGDWGSLVASTMATLYQKNILGMHLTMALPPYTPSSAIKYVMGAILPSNAVMDKTRERYHYPLTDYVKNMFTETGYMHIQITKPDTIGVALSLSPAGWAAYILEKYSTFTLAKASNLPDGGLNSNFPISLDKVLDTINIYWFTRSITTSMRLYAEISQHQNLKLDQIPTFTPTGLTFFENEIYTTPKSFVTEKYHTLLSYTTHKTAGHFAALEVPEILAEQVINFINIVEAKNKKSEL